MARRRTAASPPPADSPERILDIDVAAEMESSFLEYAYSVIYARALPDARDGLKPVQRRIMFGMEQMGLRPDRGHVKCQSIVGDVMGKYHPHGDGAIYDALVRMAQSFTLRVPLVDGHGNFGSLDDGPAAPRYTEARPAATAPLLTDSLDENVVDFYPTYDSRMMQPVVLPAAFPNLLVNGASGIAVGMATNMAPHNLTEVIDAAKHLLLKPEATLETLMTFIPGPDLPTGARIVGLGGVRDAYRTGRGTFKTRATVSIEKVTARRQGIVVTELPYLVGPEKVKEKVRDAVQAKKLQGISDIVDLTDRANGLRLVIELKSGFRPEAVLEQLYKLTPMEESFGINNVCLVDGTPKVLGLKELLEVFLAHRLEVVRRRCEFRLGKHQDRLHLVEGLLIAIVDIDRVIAIIRGSDHAAEAKTELIAAFSLSELQAEYILELRLRRLTKFSRIELETEAEELAAAIAELERLLADERALKKLVSKELTAVAKQHGTARRTVLLDDAGAGASTPGARAAAVQESLEVEDTPCWLLLSASGRIARTTDRSPIAPVDPGSKRGAHDVLTAVIPTTVRAEAAVVTSTGRMVRLPVVDCPVLPPTAAAPTLAGGTELAEFVTLAKGERVVGVCSLSDTTAGLALGTARGVVKRVALDYPAKESWDTMAVKPGDEVVGVAELPHPDCELVFVTASGQLLRFGADKVRPQGRTGGGVAGVKLADGDHVVFFGAVPATHPGAVVVTVASAEDTLPGTAGQSAKVTPLEAFPGKGRATAGVRAHRFVRGESTLSHAWMGVGPAIGATNRGKPVTLPDTDPRRDGSGQPLDEQVAVLGGDAAAMHATD